ncbi:MAG: acyl-CoA thioesterase [Kiritimatiellae bacterium]|nr:acyl-CoA thioesterase [Kiritimatiellia bacterium]
MVPDIPAAAVRTPYRVPYADTDMMGVVYYGNYLTLFERSRNELMRALGPTYAQMEEGGLMLPVVEAHVDYRAPARYDDELEIAAWLAEAHGVRCKVRCAVLRGGELLASGWTVHACVDAKTRRPARIPAWLAACVVADGGGAAPR